MINLNEQQLAYVNSSGNVTLSACPGSGKTTSIVHKVNRLMNEKHPKLSGIAILSFTNVAADEMAIKYNNFFGDNIDEIPNFNGTIDSFFNSILLRYGYLIFGKRPNIILELDSEKFEFILKQECHKCRVEKMSIGADGYLYNKEGKNFNCVIGDYSSCMKVFSFFENNAIILQKNVPFYLLRLLNKCPQILKFIKARYRLIIVDEAQDTNMNQMRIFDLLIKHGINIDFVGDSDQAIYEFNGANFQLFKDKINDLNFQSFRLLINKRSSQLICNATRVFSETISTSDRYLSESKDFNCDVKPKLILSNKVDEDGNHLTSEGIHEIISRFLSLCKEANIPINSESIAVVTRAGEAKADIWKNHYFFKRIADASYELYNGSKSRALYLAERVIYEILYGYGDKFNDSIADNININGKNLERLAIDLCRILVNPSYQLKEWYEKSKTNIKIFIDDNKITPFVPIDKSFKLKIRDKKDPDFKIKPLNFYYKRTSSNGIVIKTIHSVKGETYKALLLLVMAKGGRTLSSNKLISKKYDEDLRLAYVAMTRPEILLCVGVINDSSLNYSKSFNPDAWDYIYLDESSD